MMAYDFDGTNDYIQAPLGTSYDVPVSISCWFNSDTTNANKTLVTLAIGLVGQNTSNGFHLRITSGAQVQATIANGAGSNSAAVGTYTLQNWHHGAAVFYTTGSRYAFCDAVRSSQSTAVRTVNTNPNNIIIGQGSGGSFNPAQPFNGRIAEVGIWNVGLTDAEIAMLAKGIKPIYVRPESLLYYIPLVRDINDHVGGLTFTFEVIGDSAHSRRYG
jgi:hypothetical protein